MDIQIYYRIPSDWVRLLTTIQREVPEAIMAGGCLRDYFNERPVNDIDFFVPDSKASLAAMAIYETHPRMTKSIPEPYFTFNNDVRRVTYYEGDDVLPVNIIGVTDGTCTPWQQLERFDFGICKVAYDGKTLWKDLAYDRDVRDQTFTLYGLQQSPEQRAFSLGRYERIEAKYPGWKLVDIRPAPFDV